MSYLWMPSGMDRNYLPLNVWVRPNRAKRLGVNFDKTSATLQLPHVDVRFDTALRTKKLASIREKEGFHLRTFGPYGEWVMDSAGRGGLTPSGGNYAKASGVKMLCDSGGYTLKVPDKSGTWRNWIDPKVVIAKYNACADVGMALDAPPRLGVRPSLGLEVSPSILSILARMQRENSKIMISEKKDDLGLINIAHGVLADDFRRWIDIVHVPDKFMGWAVSCDTDDSDPITGLKQVSIYRASAILYHEFGLGNGWLHLFKVSGQREIPVAAWLGRYFGRLSSDSTSWTYGGYQQYKYLFDGQLRTLSKENLDLARGQLSDYCQCEVCDLFKTFDSIKNTEHNRSKAYRAINIHNVIVITKAVDYWNAIAKSLSFSEYLRVVESQFGRNGQLIDKLKYVECAMQEGPGKADAQFCMSSSKHFLTAA